MRLLLVLLSLSWASVYSYGQFCLPGGITFTSQAEIDAFPLDYPACWSIEGDVIIDDIEQGDIINLAPLSQLSFIGGDVFINNNVLLSSLNGLQNIATIGGRLTISENEQLPNLQGLNGLTSIGGKFQLHFNENLSTLEGLNNLTMIHGPLRIEKNSSLVSLSALTNLSAIDGGLSILECGLLTDLNGLENMDPGTITDLRIRTCSQLSVCSVPSICTYLSNPANSANIDQNDPGCNSRTEIENACTTGSCLPGGILFTSQSQLDDFPINYPGCTEIGGNVVISGADILDLNGLHAVTFIGGFLEIRNTIALSDLSGLDNLTTMGAGISLISNAGLTSISALSNLSNIGGGLRLTNNDQLTTLSGLEGISALGKFLFIWDNDKLEDLTGLNNLQSIHQGLRIGNNKKLKNLTGLNQLTSIGAELRIFDSPQLESLDALLNLTTIGGELKIQNNAILGTLAGLDNISPTSITDLILLNSASLSFCEVNSICSYLANPANPATIDNNATGCDSRSEVELNCTIPLLEKDPGQTEQLQYGITEFRVMPNPAQDRIELDVSPALGERLSITIRTIAGQILYTYQEEVQRQPVIPFSLAAIGIRESGYYWIRLESRNQVISLPLLVQ